MFKVAGVPMVENVVAGYNSCMFAYGQVREGRASFIFYYLSSLMINKSCFADGEWQNSHYAWRYRGRNT